MAHPLSFLVSHPRQFVLSCMSPNVLACPKALGPDTVELLSLPGCISLFENFHFPCIWSQRSSPRGNDSFGATPAAALRTIFRISSRRALGGGTYGRLCRKDNSQWIDVIQTRACCRAAYQCRWHEVKLFA